MLLDQLEQSRERSQRAEAAITLTGHDNEPFVVTLMKLRGRHGDVAFSIREIGTDMTTFKERYHLSQPGKSGGRAGAPRPSQQPDRRDPRHHPGHDEEASVANLRKGRRRFAIAPGR